MFFVLHLLVKGKCIRSRTDTHSVSKNNDDYFVRDVCSAEGFRYLTNSARTKHKMTFEQQNLKWMKPKTRKKESKIDDAK